MASYGDRTTKSVAAGAEAIASNTRAFGGPKKTWTGGSERRVNLGSADEFACPDKGAITCSCTSSAPRGACLCTARKITERSRETERARAWLRVPCMRYLARMQMMDRSDGCRTESTSPIRHLIWCVVAAAGTKNELV